MAFWVRNKKGEKITAGTYKKSDQGTLVCPSCGCPMSYVSESSNGKAAHFAGSHKPGCDIGLTSDSGTIDEYELSKTSIEKLLDTICAEGVRRPGTANTHPDKTSTASQGQVSEVANSVAIKVPKKLTVRTVRQLFHLLAGADPDAIIDEKNGTTVKDVYCGISTSFLYTKFISGVHLVYAEYTGPGYNANEFKFFFAFPAEKNKNFSFVAKCSSNEVYTEILDRLEIGRRVLVFADFHGKHCDIKSSAQIVQLRRG